MRRGVRIATRAPWGVLYGFCGLMLVFLAAPIVIVLLVLFADAEFVYFPPPGFTLGWYANLARIEGFVASFLLSLRLALLVSGLALILGTAASVALVRYTFPGRQWRNTFFMSPLIFPPIITGIALLQFFSTLGSRATFFCADDGPHPHHHALCGAERYGKPARATEQCGRSRASIGSEPLADVLAHYAAPYQTRIAGRRYLCLYRTPRQGLSSYLFLQTPRCPATACQCRV
jgi:hypothetical protein